MLRDVAAHPASSTLDRLQLLEYCLRIRAVSGTTDILPANDSVFVDDEGGRYGNMIACKHTIVNDGIPARVG